MSYEGPERRDETVLQEEVRELREATATLSSRVEVLSGAFQKVNDLSQRQQEVDRKAAEAVIDAARAIAAVKQIEANTIPRDEIELSNQKRDREIQHARRETTARATLIGVVGAAALMAALLFAVNYANGYKGNVYKVCVARSQQARIVRNYLENTREQALAKATSDVERAQIMAGITQLETAFPDVDCRGLR